MKLTGYTDRLSVSPGENIAFMVSCELETYRAAIVQLIHGDTNPAGPGFKSRAVESVLSGEHVGKYQRLCPGSYVRIPFSTGLAIEGSFTVQMWIWPTIPNKSTQTLISAFGENRGGFAVRISGGRLSLQVGRGGAPVILDKRLTSQFWYSVAAVFDSSQDQIRLSLATTSLTTSGQSVTVTSRLRGSARAAGADVLIAAESQIDKHGCRVGCFYNGKIDTPRLYRRAMTEVELAALGDRPLGVDDDLLAAWDFSRDIDTTRVSDVSGNGHHGKTINRPTRAVTGRTWDGSEVAWKSTPEQYAAIHFHEDDLDDAGWERSLEWTVPQDTRSGVYALHICADGEEDYLPFAVRPRRGMALSHIAFLMPTFSYLAYANNHISGRPEVSALSKAMGGTDSRQDPATSQEKYIAANRLNSLYDTHSDGSGCCYASWLRPLVSMRPKYLEKIMGVKVPHQLNADLHLVDWLVEHGYQFDVLADECLHLEGQKLLSPYKVVLTGSHPEYWSEQMIRAAQGYLRSGGRMMYLGGNGMYWVTQLDPESGHTIEMRRSQPSSPRFFDPHPGELHLSTTGQRAAPWRQRGLPTQEWLGVVMSGAGRSGQHFERHPESVSPRLAWIFRGIGQNERIGAFNNLCGGYGAAGGEVDKVDFGVEGTPRHTIVLATSAPFDSRWLWDPLDAPNTPRSNLALLEYPNGGAVFSASSIVWCSCLSYNEYDNNVSRLTRNVLEGFLHRGDLL